MTARIQPLPVFSPGLSAAEPVANNWLRQVTLRLRREICWMWQERTGAESAGSLPPLVDRLSESLDRARYWEDKQRFWESNTTARYLTQQIAMDPPVPVGPPARGSFTWVVSEAGLDRVSTFALSLGLLASFDSAAGAVIAACHNDANRTSPTLALAQKLWDAPEEVLALAESAHPLFDLGLLRRLEGGPAANEWEAPLHTPERIARRLLFPDAPPPPRLRPLRSGPSFITDLPDPVRVAARQLRSDPSELRIVAVAAPPGAAIGEVLAMVAQNSGRSIVRFEGPAMPQGIASALTLCWLDGTDLFLQSASLPRQAKVAELLATHARLPVTVFVESSDRASFDGLPPNLRFARMEVPPLSYAQRVACWTEALGAAADSMPATIAETARRFRYEPETIRRIIGTLRSVPESPITAKAITTECRAAAHLEFGDLAQQVTPRFDKAAELFLPPRQFDQFLEVLQAMRSLTDVHYRWGTARVWNEGGISVLFAGPPGTGKTMAAEILASELDLPMYRIDLSQVVNKYIGETEKNLKRIFDAADTSDALLFFDEADSIFGKRLEARDAHDRYANLEISYLLERMERFKGLAVLATNRKKDLDEAFMRRLRYVIDFPLPGADQRRRIWEQSIPAGVDASQVDLGFLAARFPMAGGHIRSVVFNACLQCAGSAGRPALRMDAVLVALKRELDKVNRPVGLELFEGYAPIIRRMERETDERAD